MRKYRFFFVAIVALLLASCACAELKITIAGKTYTGRPLGNTVVYQVGGQKLGEARQIGDSVSYRDARGAEVGTAKPLGDAIIFRDGRGREIGTRKPLGDKHIYRDGRGLEIGEARVLGWKTQYTNGRGLIIGEADTKDMPLRPLPLELLLGGSGDAPKVHGLCLPQITNVKADGAAQAAGLMANDIIIGCRGEAWTTFDFMGSEQGVVQNRMRPKMEEIKERDGLVMIVYRPGAGEKDSAAGTIVASAPMPAGLRGYVWKAQESGTTFTRKGSLAYYEQIADIYRKWLADGNDGPALRMPVCLLRVTKVIPGSQAEASGMRIGDIFIGIAGQDGNFLDYADTSYKRTFDKIEAKLVATQKVRDLRIIVYRPAKGEKNAAAGEIVALLPMQPGKKGYSYLVSEDAPTYTRSGSSEYAAQIRALYAKWLEAGNEGPALKQ